MNLKKIAGVIECIGGLSVIAVGFVVGLSTGWSGLGIFASIALEAFGAFIYTDGFVRATENKQKQFVPEESHGKNIKSENISHYKPSLKHQSKNKPALANIVDFTFSSKNRPTFFGNAHYLPQQSFSNQSDKRASYSPS